jgi:dipeptidase
MPCTTVLVGRKASYDGSTMIARNDDSGAGSFCPKKFTVVKPEEQPKIYKSVISHVTIELPENPMRYTAVPNAIKGEGIWAAAGVNAANVAMTATETITSNERVIGADPLVRLKKAAGDTPEVPGGIGEEDLVVITLPYIHSAKEGAERVGALLEKYGTYEMNGMAFQDVNDIWWLESIGGHHWIARRLPEDAYIVAPNQFGIDQFDLNDAFGDQKNYMCSKDMREFIAENHLDLSNNGVFNARDAFGSHDDSDHVYNTPRAWFGERYLNPKTSIWDGNHAEYTPTSDDIPWCRVPEKKVTVEDVKYILSSYYQGTEYNPYDAQGKHVFRPIGVNRTSHVALIQLRPYVPEEIQAVEWIAFASNSFNSFVPYYGNVDSIPAYMNNTTADVSTDNFYWANRLIGALADADYHKSASHIERYQKSLMSTGHEMLNKYDHLFAAKKDMKLLNQANEEMTAAARKLTDECLDHVLYERSNTMRNGFSRSDA